MKTISQNPAPALARSEALGWLELVRRQVATLQFGVVQIIVHESKVVQVERTEKVRLTPSTTQTNLTADQATGGSATYLVSPT
jgi:hypothetical protein